MSPKDPSASSSKPAASVDLVECASPHDDEISFVGQVISVCAAGLVSSPGWGAIDTGCGRTLIGSQTLDELNQKLIALGKSPAKEYAAINRFRFGNGQEETSERAVRIPVAISGTPGLIDAAVISGQAPLLLGRPTLEKLHVQLDFRSASMKLLKPEIDASMVTNDAGQLLVNILDFKQKVDQQKHDQPSAGANDQESRVGDKMSQSSNKRKKITLKQKECRCLLAQMKSAENTKQSQFQVAELFSPPRFSLEVEKHGVRGWHLTSSKVGIF